MLKLSGVRPFGVSLLIAGWDSDENVPYLYQCDPSVSHFIQTFRVKITKKRHVFCLLIL